MIFFFKRVLLAPMIGVMCAIPSIYLFDYFDWLGDLSVLASTGVGFVAVLIGFLIGKIIEHRFT